VIRIASYNIRKSIGRDRRRKPERILGVLEELAADVVVLQEADRRFGRRRASSLPPSAIEADTDYQVIDLAIRPDSLGWHGNAVLVRRGVAIIEAHRLELPALEPRGAVIVELEDRGLRFRVVGAHLSLLRRWRRLQAAAILKRLDELEGHLPTVIIGDFNDWSHDAPSLEAISKRYSGHAPGKSYPAYRPVAPLDRLFHDDGIEVLAAGVHHSPLAGIASDHLPIWAEVAARKPGEEAKTGHKSEGLLAG
jgi:endonuclease/exonuclease/phosphatase family metal-dependent hydrolase